MFRTASEVQFRPPQGGRSRVNSAAVQPSNMFKIQSVKKADTSFRVEGDETVHLVNLPSILHDIAVLLEIAEELCLVINLIGRDRGTEILQGPVPRPIRQWNLIYDNSLGRRNERVDKPGQRFLHILNGPRRKEDIGGGSLAGLRRKD